MVGTRISRVVSTVALAITVGGAALLQAGCIDDSQGGGAELDESATTDTAQVAGDADVAGPSVAATSWTAAFISVDHAADSSGKKKVLDIRGGVTATGTEHWRSCGPKMAAAIRDGW